MSKRVTITPGKMSKGGHNPNNESDARPAPPKGSGGRDVRAELKRDARLNEQRADFIQALAEYLAGPLSVEHSIGLGVPEGSRIRAHADLWAKMRQATPLFGYPTVEEARGQLAEFLGLQIVYEESA